MENPDHVRLKETLRAQWAAMAQEWIEGVELGCTRNAHREGLLDSWMLDAVGDVSGLDVVDLGCGEGRFSRMLAERGAQVIGLDLNERFIEYANGHRVKEERYVLGDMEDLAYFADGNFDLAVCYITLDDVPDHERAIGEAFRVLRP